MTPLTEILTRAQIPPSKQRRIIAALNRAAKPKTPRSLHALIQRDGEWHLERLVQSRVEEDQGQYFTIKNIQL